MHARQVVCMMPRVNTMSSGPHRDRGARTHVFFTTHTAQQLCSPHQQQRQALPPQHGQPMCSPVNCAATYGGAGGGGGKEQPVLGTQPECTCTQGRDSRAHNTRTRGGIHTRQKESVTQPLQLATHESTAGRPRDRRTQPADGAHGPGSPHQRRLRAPRTAPHSTSQHLQAAL
jgi:hypothetical protein